MPVAQTNFDAEIGPDQLFEAERIGRDRAGIGHLDQRNAWRGDRESLFGASVPGCKLAFRGVVLEPSFHEARRIADPDAVLGDMHLAPVFTEPRILLDPFGRLEALRAFMPALRECCEALLGRAPGAPRLKPAAGSARI